MVKKQTGFLYATRHCWGILIASACYLLLMFALGNYYSAYLGIMVFGESYLKFLVALSFPQQLMGDSPIGVQYYLPQIVIVLFWGTCFYWLYRLARTGWAKTFSKFGGSH